MCFRYSLIILLIVAFLDEIISSDVLKYYFDAFIGCLYTLYHNPGVGYGGEIWTLDLGITEILCIPAVLILDLVIAAIAIRSLKRKFHDSEPVTRNVQTTIVLENWDLELFESWDDDLIYIPENWDAELIYIPENWDAELIYIPENWDYKL